MPKRGAFLNDAKPLGLQFNSQEDAINYVRQITEDSSRWLAFHNLNLIEHYVKGEFYIASNLTILSTGREYDLLVSGIPTLGHENSTPPPAL